MLAVMVKAMTDYPVGLVVALVAPMMRPWGLVVLVPLGKEIMAAPVLSTELARAVVALARSGVRAPETSVEPEARVPLIQLQDRL